MRFVRTFLWLFVVAGAGLRGDPAEDLARIHVEAIGGRERIEALSSLRATGQVQASGNIVRFTLVAARPNRLRLETVRAGRTVVQGTDGVEPPWEFDNSATPAQYKAMAEMNAKTFAADAEFDDPLVAGASRGYAFDYAGTVDVDGKKLLRLLVTRKMTDTFSLLLDEETYLILMRIEHRISAGGRKLQVVTHYEDFRPVNGVLLPHQVAVTIDGRVTQHTRIAKIEANPALEPDVFSRPRVALPITAPR